MFVIPKGASLQEFALLVASALSDLGIDTTLVGGAVVTIYTLNKHQSKDLDFVSPQGEKKLRAAMDKLGFTKVTLKDYRHPDTKFTVEFPGFAVFLGTNTPVIGEGRIEDRGRVLKLLSPTQCVIDRVTHFFNSRDRQALEQALMVASDNKIDFEMLKEYCLNPDSGWAMANYDDFMARYEIYRAKITSAIPNSKPTCRECGRFLRGDRRINHGVCSKCDPEFKRKNN